MGNFNRALQTDLLALLKWTESKVLFQDLSIKRKKKAPQE